MADKNLDARESRFVNEYLIDLDPKRAALAAGYSATTAASKAYQWVSNSKVKPQVYKAIAKIQERLAQKVEVTQERIVAELAKVGFSDMRNFTEWGPGGVQLKDSSDLEPGQAACVAEVSESTTKDGGSIRFKLHDKVAALHLLMKHLGMLRDKVELTGKDGGPIESKFEVKHTFDHDRFAALFRGVAEPGDSTPSGNGS